MPGHHSDRPDPGQGFDPSAHRREIEMMEQRFRERSDRSGGPISTGEIDARVQDEMNEFFTESSQKLEQVVPNLAEEENHSMKETTGEIRRKIDDFFSQVAPAPGDERAADAGGGDFGGGGFGGGSQPEPAPAAPAAPDPAGGFGGRIQHTSPFGRGSPGAGAADPAPAPEGQPGQRGGLPPSAFGHTGLPNSGGPRSLRSNAGGERPRLDLKTALEKLKRSGVVGGAGSGQRPAPPAAPTPAPAAAAPPPTPAPVPAAAPSPPPAPVPEPPPRRDPQPEPPPPPPPPRPRQIRPPETTRGGDRRNESREIPLPRAFDPAPAKKDESPGAGLDRFAFRPEEGPRPGPRKPKTQTIPIPPKSGSASLGRTRPAPEPPRERSSSEVPAPRGFPQPQSGVSAPPPPSETLPQFGAAARAGARLDADPAGSFDNIFNEVQNLVLDSLKGSVSDTFGHAQELTNEISQEISQRISQRISDVALRAAQAARAQVEAERTARTQGRRPDAPSPAPQSRRPADPYPRLEPEDEAPPQDRRAPEAHRDRPPQPPRGRALSQMLSAPSDEEEEFEEPQEEAPPAPYDWGVKKKQQPPGAWLLNKDAPVPKSPVEERPQRAEQRPERAGPRPEHRPEAPARPAPEPGATSDPEAPVDQPFGAAGGMGARGYLMKKLGQEMDKLGPTLDALARKGVVEGAELRELKGDEPEFDDDAELSVDTFVDARPRDEAGDGMTPMKLVEQLRNVRRLQEILLSKGLVSADELDKAPEE